MSAAPPLADPLGSGLESLGAGFADPVHAAQQCFRHVLDAMAHPGRIQRLAPAWLAGVCPPPSTEPASPYDLATTAVLLTLLDAEAAVHLAGPMDSPAARTYLRFHTGTAGVEAATALWSVARAGRFDLTLLEQLPLGDDDRPQEGATLLIEVPGLDEREALPGAHLLRLRGPGIPDTRDLAVQCLPTVFWAWRQAQQALFPRGVDLLLCCGDRFVALPRSTHLTLEG